MKKPFLEIVKPSEGQSLRIHHSASEPRCNVRSWHYHPEIELVVIPNGKGRLYIGNRLYPYSNGVLVLLHSNIAHKSFDNGFESEHYEEFVVQVAPKQIETLSFYFPEFEKINRLIDAAKEGVVLPLSLEKGFFREKCTYLLSEDPFGVWITFMEILGELAKTKYEVLGVESGNNLNGKQTERIEKVFQYIGKHYQENISSESVAAMLHLTNSSFCRFFQKHTQKTFKQVLNEYRINHACKQLAFSEKSIEQIAYEVGFTSQSFFNKVFKTLMQITPMRYRQERQGIRTFV